MESTAADRDLILSKTGLFPLRFLGVGVYLAWLFTIHFSTSVFETSDRALDSLILSNLANLTCLVLAAFFARKIAPISTKKGFVWTAGASSFLGTAVASLAPLGAVAGDFLFVTGNALIGAGTSLLI